MQSTVEVTLSTYLASLYATSDLVKVILPVSLPSSEPSLIDDTLSYWFEGRDFQLPVEVDALKQNFRTSKGQYLQYINLCRVL